MLDKVQIFKNIEYIYDIFSLWNYYKMKIFYFIFVEKSEAKISWALGFIRRLCSEILMNNFQS